MLHFLGRTAVAHPRKVLLAWAAVAVAVALPAPNWDRNTQDDDIRFLPADSPTARGQKILEDAFPAEVAASKAIVAVERADGPLTPADLGRVERAADELRRLRREDADIGITSVVCFKDGPIGARLMADDGRCTLIQIGLSSPYLAVQTRDRVDRVEAAVRSEFADSGLAIYATGPAGLGRDLVKASADGLNRTTLATLALVVVVLLAVYRSPLLALVPVLSIGMAAWVSIKLLALATLIPGVRLVNVSQIFLVVILFGAGTDYCLFLISRYREELERGDDPEAGIARTLRSVAGALAASAATVACGLATMGFAEFGKIRTAGPVMAVGLGVGLLAALTLTPALLRLGRFTLFWPLAIRLKAPADAAATLWGRISGFVVRRPGAVLLIAVVPLTVLALFGLRVKPSFKPTGDLSPQAGSVRGVAAVRRHFTPGETGPLTVLLKSDRDWSSPAGRDLIDRLARGLGYLPGIAEVRALTQPLGKPLASVERPPPPADKPIKGFLDKAAAKIGSLVDSGTRVVAEKHYVSRVDGGFVTKLDVVFESDPFDRASTKSLALVETWLTDIFPDHAAAFGRVETACSGVTLQGRDLERVVTRDRIVVNACVTVAVFLILLAVVRKAWLAGYLLSTVMLSYFATLGLTALFASWTTGRPFGELEWRVPFFLFVILVAVGEDYNILLVSRIFEERDKHGHLEGIRRGLMTTGGTITSCGLIMAGTFGTLMLTDLNTLRQIGFALAAGVLLDTLVVRPFLVPAALVLMWQSVDPPAVRREIAAKKAA